MNFIITVDTEGDNQWSWKLGEKINTENSKYIDTFQTLCEEYGYKPVYLINYEMAQSDVLLDTIKKPSLEGRCEIGMHLHAWNTPPDYDVSQKFDGCPYITEYPKEIIEAKHQFLKSYLEDRYEQEIVSYRAGRWATSDTLFDILEDLSFKVDCSVTPGINHNSNPGRSVAGGNDYSRFSNKPFRIRENLIEVPMTTCKKRRLKGSSIRAIASHIIKGKEQWLRPAVSSLGEMIEMIETSKKNGFDYVDLMIHSSELMPGGSPYCKNLDDVNQMLLKVECVFKTVQKEYKGITLKEYYEIIKTKV